MCFRKRARHLTEIVACAKRHTSICQQSSCDAFDNLLGEIRRILKLAVAEENLGGLQTAISEIEERPYPTIRAHTVSARCARRASTGWWSPFVRSRTHPLGTGRLRSRRRDHLSARKLDHSRSLRLHPPAT